MSHELISDLFMNRKEPAGPCFDPILSLFISYCRFQLNTPELQRAASKTLNKDPKFNILDGVVHLEGECALLDRDLPRVRYNSLR